MNIISEVGIDASKDTLEISVSDKKTKTITNSSASVHGLAKSLPEKSVIHIEATGGFERLARRILVKHGHIVYVHNPKKTRRLADALAVNAKTDSIDAKFLREHGSKLPATRSKTDQHEGLTDLSRTIDGLKDDIAGYRKTIQHEWLSNAIVECYQAIIQAMAAEVLRLERLFVREVRQSSLKDKYEQVLSIPSIGPACARVCVCELPEDLENLTGAQASSYCGIAPLDNSSGKKNGPRKIGPGNMHLKAALYMPAIVAIRHQDWARTLYYSLKDKGRKHQQAIVAIMRRLLLRAFAVMKRGYGWRENLQEMT